MIQEGLYSGSVHHQRKSPPYRFERRLLLAYCDVDSVDRSPRGRIRLAPGLPIFVRKQDYLGCRNGSLRSAVEELVTARLGKRPTGPIALLTQPRAFGWTVNPISLIYCYAEQSSELEAIVAEVTNTPWGERHAYVLPGSGDRSSGADFYHAQKKLHVSPFFGMEQDYVFRVPIPCETIQLSIGLFERDHAVFRADMKLSRTASFGWKSLPHLLRRPLMPMQTQLGIYGHALRLALERAPFFPHPKKLSRRTESHAASQREPRRERTP